MLKRGNPGVGHAWLACTIHIHVPSVTVVSLVALFQSSVPRTHAPSDQVNLSPGLLVLPFALICEMTDPYPLGPTPSEKE